MSSICFVHTLLHKCVWPFEISSHVQYHRMCQVKIRNVMLHTIAGGSITYKVNQAFVLIQQDQLLCSWKCGQPSNMIESVETNTTTPYCLSKSSGGWRHFGTNTLQTHIPPSYKNILAYHRNIYILYHTILKLKTVSNILKPLNHLQLKHQVFRPLR